MRVPDFGDIAVVTASAAFALQQSLLLRQGSEYVPVFETPRAFDQVDANDVAKLVTTLVRLAPSRVIIGPQEQDAVDALRESIGDRLEVDVVSDDDFDHCSTAKVMVSDPINGPSHLVASAAEELSLDESHAIVLERTPDVNGIIAANLAVSLGARLLEIEPVDRDEVEDFCGRLMYAREQDRDPADEIADLREELALRAPQTLGDFESVTFVTNGLPYGFAFQGLVSSHLYVYPDLGLQIANDYLCSRQGSTGVRVAVTIDPSEQGKELKVIEQVLDRRGAFIRTLVSTEATVERAGLCLEAFPFDFAAISTHCGEIEGRRVAYRFTDSEGRKRVLIAEQALEFGTRPRTRTVMVQKFSRFVSLDGVDWRDRAGKDEIDANGALESYVRLRESKDPGLVEEDLGPCGKIRECLALEMNDGVLIPALNMVGDQLNPVILNNACSSWHSLSLRFMHAGARGYLGTLFPVLQSEAEDLVWLLFGRHVHRAIPDALYRAQSELYSDGRNPYIYFGAPFARLPKGVRTPREYLTGRLRHAVRKWEEYIEEQEDEQLKDSANRLMYYLIEEYAYLGEELEGRA